MKCPSQSLYLANKYFEHRMNKHRVTLELVHLFSTGSAVYLLLQGIIYSKKEEKKKNMTFTIHFIYFKILSRFTFNSQHDKSVSPPRTLKKVSILLAAVQAYINVFLCLRE